MSSSRWDPWGDLVGLREAMNNLLEESLVRPRSHLAGGTGSTAGLALDVRETADRFVVTASVPGVGPDDMDITVLGDTLRISGERRADDEEHPGAEGGRWLIRERRYGAFERVVSLPAPVKPDAATAEFKDGVLTIILPKADAAKPRSISVRAGAGAGQRQEIDVATDGQDTRQSEALDEADNIAAAGAVNPLPSTTGSS